MRLVGSKGISEISLTRYTATLTELYFDQTINGVTSLSVTGFQINSISGFEYLVDLQTLNLSSNEITDISDLASCSSLTTVTLSSNSISDIGLLGELTELTSLTLSSNQIDGLIALKDLNKLATLDLSDNCINDTSTYTDDEGNPVKYQNLQILADLNENGALQTLYLSGNSITDYSLISGLSWTAKDF